MSSLTSTLAPNVIGRLAVVTAVLLQAAGKIAYGTLLTDVPSPVFVTVSFTLTAMFFLALSSTKIGKENVPDLILLNLATALTFLSFFYALKQIEPAIVGAIEIGVGPILALLGAVIWTRAVIRPARVVVCLGIGAGCTLLGASAIAGTSLQAVGGNAVLGIAASFAAGIGAVLITAASKRLLSGGWSSRSVLAHRFYLIIPLALALTFANGIPGEILTLDTALSIIGVSIVAVLAPLFLLQIGVKHCDVYTVMVTMAALPVITFVLEGFSPAYNWTWMTGIGVTVVASFIVLDIATSRRVS